jgi:LacI family transcriptional regulator
MERSQPAQTRYVGCEQAFLEQGEVFEPDRQYESALFSIADGYRAMGRLLDKMKDLTAVFAMSDVMAVGAIRALRDRGRKVPEDVSVIGFDGIELGSYLTPKLATIRQEREQIADRSVEILLSCINEEAKAVHELVPFRIISGESTGRAYN